MRRLSIRLHIEFGRDPDDERETQTIPASIERANPEPDERAEMDGRTFAFRVKDYRPIGFRAREDR